MKKIFLVLSAFLLLAGESFAMGSKNDKAARSTTEPTQDSNMGRDTGTGSTAGTMSTNSDSDQNTANNPATAKPDEYDTAMGRKKTPGEKRMSRGSWASGTTTPPSTY